MTTPPIPVQRTNPYQGTLVTRDGVPIQCMLDAHETHVVIAGPADSVRIPIQALTTTPAETGPAATEVQQVAQKQLEEIRAQEAQDRRPADG